MVYTVFLCYFFSIAFYILFLLNTKPIEPFTPKTKKAEHLIIPYEEKYLKEVREMKNEYVFTEEELEWEKELLKKELLEKELLKKKLLEKEIAEITEKMYAFIDKHVYCSIEEVEDYKNESIKQTIHHFHVKIQEREKQLKEIVENEQIVKKKCREKCLERHLQRKSASFLMEHTPNGNVLFFYNHKKEAFEYYSDSIIPYRYLEVVARKYVLMNQLRPLYVDMDEELRNKKEKEEKEENKKEEKEENKKEEKEMEEEEKEEKEMEEEEKEENKKEEKVIVPVPKKNVFAKFKTYNKEGGTGHVNTTAPPKNSFSQTQLLPKENQVFKESANRYSYQGKMANFSVLQKVERKKVDKKYGMSFSDFKKSQK